MTNDPTNINNKIIDVDLSAINKKKFRFNKDDSRIVELNTSDMHLITRFNEAYPKLQELQTDASDWASKNISDDDISEDTIGKTAEMLIKIDNKMRELIDYIFDAKVSDATAPDGSMYDPFNGAYRYEYILNAVMGLYESNLTAEYKKMEKKLKSHTTKYAKR